MSRAMRGVALAAALALLGAGWSPALAAARVVAKKEVTGVLNLNTATAQQLDQLPGVGAKAAKRILEFRAKTPFGRPEDLARVKGFGPKRLTALRPYLTVTGPTTLVVRKLPPPPPAAAAAPAGRPGPATR
jgi:competence protein ComEA